MEVWFDKNVLYYDAIINGITPNYIQLETTIIEIDFDGKDVHIKGTPQNAVVSSLDNHHLTRVEYK